MEWWVVKGKALIAACLPEHSGLIDTWQWRIDAVVI
jgi:hypothetical protein